MYIWSFNLLYENLTAWFVTFYVVVWFGFLNSAVLLLLSVSGHIIREIKVSYHSFKVMAIINSNKFDLSPMKKSHILVLEGSRFYGGSLQQATVLSIFRDNSSAIDNATRWRGMRQVDNNIQQIFLKNSVIIFLLSVSCVERVQYDPVLSL